MFQNKQKITRVNSMLFLTFYFKIDFNVSKTQPSFKSKVVTPVENYQAIYLDQHLNKALHSQQPSSSSGTSLVHWSFQNNNKVILYALCELVIL